MIIECPECGTKNQTDTTPQPDKRYRCGKCKSVITYQQIIAYQNTLTEAIEEKPLPERQKTIATPPKAVSGNGQPAKRELGKKTSILTTGKGISRRFLIIIAIMLVALILVYYYVNYG